MILPTYVPTYVPAIAPPLLFAAGLFFVPSDVVDPVSHFETLKTSMTLPPLMEREVMYTSKDAFFPKLYVLLHDRSREDEALLKKTQDNLNSIVRHYGPHNCCVLRINGSNGERQYVGAFPEVYRAHMHSPLPGGGAGEAVSRPQVMGVTLTTIY